MNFTGSPDPRDWDPERSPLLAGVNGSAVNGRVANGTAVNGKAVGGVTVAAPVSAETTAPIKPYGRHAKPVPEKQAKAKKPSKKGAGRKKGKAVDAAQPPPPPAHTPLRRRKWLDKGTYYEPGYGGMKTTTRQAEALNVAMAGPPSSPKGLFVGQDAVSGQMVLHDVFQAYEDGLLTSPNFVVIGDVGKGKSSLLKTWAVLRPLILAGRRAVVIDKKLQRWADGTRSGENTQLARFFGAEPIAFRIGGGGSCINPLDPAIAALVDERQDGEDGTDLDALDGERPAGQSMLLRGILHRALDRPLTPREGKAVREAHRAALLVGSRESRQATLRDVYDALLHPSADAAERAVTSHEDMREWGRDAAYELDRLIDDDLRGLIDGPTTPNVRLNSQLTVFDVSRLPEEGPALPVVMTIINTWLSNLLATERQRWRTHFIVEEGWHLVAGPTAKVFQRNWKLARGLGLSNGVAIHHVSDVPEDSPAVALLKEAETTFIYGQARHNDAAECVRLFGLPAVTGDIIRTLPKGVCLMKVGSRPPLMVRHLRSEIEGVLTNTDSAMVSGSSPE